MARKYEDIVNDDIRRRVQEMRGQSISWVAIGVALNFSKTTAKKIGVEIGCPEALPRNKITSDETKVGGRMPLPAGHHETWQAITRGTLLEGCEYPNDGT